MEALLRGAVLRDWGMRTTIKGSAKNDGHCDVYRERLPRYTHQMMDVEIIC